MKKLLSLVLILSLLSVIPSSVLASDVKTITVFTGIETYTPEDINSMTIYKKSEAATGIRVEWSTVAQSSYAEKLGVLLATENLPDVIFGQISTPQLSKYGAEGLFIPMESYFTEEKMPNLYKIIEQYPALLSFVTAPDGHVYGVPKATEGPWNQVSRIYSINEQWLANLSISAPTTLEEFKDMLVAFRDKDPNGNGIKDEIPFSFAGGTFNIADFEYIFGAYGIVFGNGTLDVDSGKVVMLAQDERFKQAIKYIGELYAENLIDPDIFVMDNAQWKAKISAAPGIIGVSPNWDHNDNISTPSVLAQYGFMKPLKGIEGEDPLTYSPISYGYSRGFGVITKACKDIDAAIRWIDYWFDPINSIEASEGPIGERQYVNAEGVIVTGLGDSTIVAELPPRASVAINPYTVRALLRDYYRDGVTGIPSTYPKVDFINANVVPYADKDPFDYKLYYTVDESDTIALLQTDLFNTINSRCAEWIINGTVDAEWDAFQQELMNMGLERYLAVQQGAYDRMYGENSQ